VTAEEGGLRGSEYYANHPLYPPAKTAIALNYDAIYPWGRLTDLVLTGAERTTAYPQAQQIAKRLGLEIAPDTQPEQGHFFRSDHFPFAHAGIPAFSVGNGANFAGKPAVWGEKAYEEYNNKNYHQPSDEFHDDWDFTALQQAADFGFLLATEIANQDKLPDWRSGDQFHR
jgi:Zn-dependent M28 family amino/carboxypeptidase